MIHGAYENLLTPGLALAPRTAALTIAAVISATIVVLAAKAALV
ncbi:hypothetical protein ACPOL_3930 [Acidisarcina polymorpha]|uniref:Uncharacterized protein n=1 Tax=Acidisarcina polymorpha TaxID=2211140 RepID=A0A2Z5G2E5_9BACT|nr:hypothetical protein ACPOL_3930 [Acidisarcina polymorpha]